MVKSEKRRVKIKIILSPFRIHFEKKRLLFLAHFRNKVCAIHLRRKIGVFAEEKNIISL